MNKRVVIITTSLRPHSNSNALAEAFAKGAEAGGNIVETISLVGKKIAFCTGCFACQELGHCVIDDDAVAIEAKVMEADVVVWATPIYYYEMSGQMKTLIDRMNAMYRKDYKFRDVYLLTTAADDEEETPYGAITGIKGWVVCYPKASLKGTLFCGGVNEPDEIKDNPKLQEAYKMGLNV